MSLAPTWIIVLWSVVMAAVVTRALLAWKGRPRAVQGQEQDLSVIIPLKGWDHGLPSLLRGLLQQDFSARLQVILVLDENHPHAQELPRDDRLLLLHPPAKPPEWLDKNWRMFQGFAHACHPAIMFMDSDVVVDTAFLKHRLAQHRGAFSYSIPLYPAPGNLAARFLAAFTNYTNLMMYRAVSMVYRVATAIGPCMVFTVDRAVLREALEATRGEVADDHALGFVFSQRGLQVECSPEPVVVGKHDANMTEVLGQVVRWLMLPRSCMHMVTVGSVLALGISSLLHLMAPLWMAAGAMAWLLGKPSVGTVLFCGGVVLLAVESVLLVGVERAYTRRRYPAAPWHHLSMVPVMLLVQPLLVVFAAVQRDFRWRGTRVTVGKPPPSRTAERKPEPVLQDDG